MQQQHHHHHQYELNIHSTREERRRYKAPCWCLQIQTFAFTEERSKHRKHSHPYESLCLPFPRYLVTVHDSEVYRAFCKTPLHRAASTIGVQISVSTPRGALKRSRQPRLLRGGDSVTRFPQHYGAHGEGSSQEWKSKVWLVDCKTTRQNFRHYAVHGQGSIVEPFVWHLSQQAEWSSLGPVFTFKRVKRRLVFFQPRAVKRCNVMAAPSSSRQNLDLAAHCLSRPFHNIEFMVLHQRSLYVHTIATVSGGQPRSAKKQWLSLLPAFCTLINISALKKKKSYGSTSLKQLPFEV